MILHTKSVENSGKRKILYDFSLKINKNGEKSQILYDFSLKINKNGRFT